MIYGYETGTGLEPALSLMNQFRIALATSIFNILVEETTDLYRVIRNVITATSRNPGKLKFHGRLPATDHKRYASPNAFKAPNCDMRRGVA